MKKIKTTVEVVTTTGKEASYVSRELVDLLQTKRNGFVAVYKEQRFKIEEREVVVDEKGTIEKQVFEVVIETLKQQAAPLSDKEVNLFFSLAEGGVNSLDEYNNLQAQAMLYDTISQNDGRGRYNTTEWVQYV